MPYTADLIVFAYTGNRKYAGTDNAIHIILHGDGGTSSKDILLNHYLSNEFESGQIDTFKLSHDHVRDLQREVRIERVEIWKDKTLWSWSSDWFAEKIVVENSATHEVFVFPLFRWIKSGQHYHIKQLDTSLPQFDDHLKQRRKELVEKKKSYRYDQRFTEGPVQVVSLPLEENFPAEYEETLVTGQARLTVVSAFAWLFSWKWKRIEDIKSIYKIESFETPRGLDRWKCDVEFGRQRIASINPFLIYRVISIPEKLPVTDDLLGPLLDGLTLKKAIDQKRLFMVDLEVLEDIPVREGFSLCKPIALFFVNKSQQLVPIAIQLFQEPGPENPIFTPLDRPLLWALVKMWYNNSDAQHHQAQSHLGLTHLLMEGCAISTNRNLSPSHPVFKILAPHFLYLIPINWRAMRIFLSEGGVTDRIMNIGSKGMKALITKGIKSWRLGVDGLVPEDLKARGIEDPQLIPGFFYRDDALMLYNAIMKYVMSYIHIYYTSPEMVWEDAEVQAWAKELVKPRNYLEGGCGIKDVPGDGKIKCTDDLAKILTSIIFACSAKHAVVNFAQYDEYGFPPNYPLIMRGLPPKSKENEVSEADILGHLADKRRALDTMTVAQVLSQRGTNSLGHFELQYIFDPKAMAVVDQFRQDLKEISKSIRERNERENSNFDYLDPENIPNSIGI